MRIYKISFTEYVFQKSQDDSTLGAQTQFKYVAAKDAIEAADALRADIKGRIEISVLERVCQVDIISKPKFLAAS